MNMRDPRTAESSATMRFALTPIARSVQLALLPGLIAGFGSASVLAAPIGGHVRAGQGQINQSGNQTTINQSSQRLAVDWASFNVAHNELVQFKQPNAKASALNRIFDQKPSQIFGQIKANGQVVLVNPNGVYFKPGAEVNVGGLIAAATHVGVNEFMSGHYQLDTVSSTSGRVVNEGLIEAAPMPMWSP